MDWDGIPFWEVFLWVMILNTFMYLVALCRDDHSIIDVAWGPMFVVADLCVLYRRSPVLLEEEQTSPVIILVFSLTLIWAVRLAFHTAIRHQGEDWRYTRMRESWSGCPLPCRALCSYVWIFLMDALFSICCNAAGLHVL